MAPWPDGSSRTVVAAVLIAVAFATVSAEAANNGQGQGTFKVRPFAEMQTSDAAVAPLSGTPTSDDPGPRVWDDVDRLQFNARYTNTRHIVLLEVSSATDSQAATTMTVQGTTHTIADWVHARTDQTTKYATVRASGTHDANDGAYTVPGGFTQDGQGTVAIRTYDRTTPEDGGTPTTIHWAYDSSQDRYWFDTADKDFTNGNGETEVSPASKKASLTYLFAASGINYAVTSVGDAGSGFVPTIAQGWDKQPGKANGEDFDAYVLLDFPSGTPNEQFEVTLRASIQTTK